MSTEKQADKFGTFGGVFTPCVLTILGVIMFLRFGQIVGEAGVWHGLAIVLAAKLITISPLVPRIFCVYSSKGFPIQV